MIAEVIKNITSELPASVKLIAVSKFHPVEAVMEAYNIGQRLFGENKVQEMTAKHEVLPAATAGFHPAESPAWLLRDPAGFLR